MSMQEGGSALAERDGTVVARPPSHVDQATSQLTQQVEELDKAVAMLAERIQPYLREESLPERKYDDDERPVMVGPAERIRAMSFSLDSLTMKLHGLRDLFEG